MSIIKLLPKVVREGRREAQRILDGLASNSRVTLQTNELVLPNKDRTQKDSTQTFPLSLSLSLSRGRRLGAIG